MSQDPSTAISHQLASNNTGPTIQIGGTNTGSISITRRPKLPLSSIPQPDREAAAENLWAYTPTPQRAAESLVARGIGVITGERGTGRRISAIRALQIRLSVNSDYPQLYEIAPDWDDEETLDIETLPELTAACGYLIEASSRPFTSQDIQSLIEWAEKLHEIGSCLLITGNLRDWHGPKEFEVIAKPPDAIKVAHNHLAKRFECPTHAAWIQPESDRNQPHNFKRPASEPTTGALSGIITQSVTPSDAVDIARRIRDIDSRDITQAVEQRNKKDPDMQERGEKAIRGIRDKILLWTDFLEKTLAEKGTRGQDRIMLLSAAYLEGASIELCIKAAAAFGPPEEETARRYREGRSPRRRMRDVGVDVTSTDVANFENRPGLGKSAIRTDWHHWADEREETRAWIERITASDGVAKYWTKQVGERLLELSQTAVDPPFFSVLEKWVTEADKNDDRVDIVAQLLTQAAHTEELSRNTHKTLLDWASQKVNSRKRKTVARVCSDNIYGKRWPHRALVRLRHVLAYDDDAAEIAACALKNHAASSPEELSRIVKTIQNWIENYPEHAAGPRAFLALVDPSQSDCAAPLLINSVQTNPQIRDFLISGWNQTLKHPDVREKSHNVLLAWSQAVHHRELDQKSTFGILTDVRDSHTPVDAMSRFLYGNPETEDPALVNARFALANLHYCDHNQCPQPECPLKQPQGGHTNGSTENDTNEE